MVRSVVNRHAKWNARKWRGYQLTVDDFASVFWEEAYRLAEQPYRPSRYTLYQTLDVAFTRRALDLVRRETRHWRKDEPDEFSEPPTVPMTRKIADSVIDGIQFTDVNVTNRLFVEQMIADPTLTDDERKLLAAKYRNPDASCRQLARLTDSYDHKRVQRQWASIQRKLSKYYVDAR